MPRSTLVSMQSGGLWSTLVVGHTPFLAYTAFASAFPSSRLSTPLQSLFYNAGFYLNSVCMVAWHGAIGTFGFLPTGHRLG